MVKRVVVWFDGVKNEPCKKLCNNEQELKELYAYIDSNNFISAEFLCGKCNIPGIHTGGETNCQ